MKSYNPGNPLIFIHVPKTAGSSLKSIFEKWYGSNLINHYYDEITGKLPQQYDLQMLNKSQSPLLVYGHFNRDRGFGVEQYYPEVNQFMTMLRDPFEAAISLYYFSRKVGGEFDDQSNIPTGKLREYLISTPPNMLNHFPREVTKENYRDLIAEYFIEIGVTECFEESVMNMAEKLDKPYRRKIFAYQNITKRTEDHPQDLKEEYIERNSLEFEVYNYVRSSYGAGVESVRHADLLKSNIETTVKDYARKGRKLIVRLRK